MIIFKTFQGLENFYIKFHTFPGSVRTPFNDLKLDPSCQRVLLQISHDTKPVVTTQICRQAQHATSNCIPQSVL